MALVLGRNPGESIIILGSNGEKTRVEVVKSKTGLRLKIEAPSDVKVIRGEIYYHGSTDGATKN